MTAPGPVCPIHGKPGLVIYPCCVGAKGGQAATPAKQAASRVNAAKARQASQDKRRASGNTMGPAAPDRPP